MTDRPWYRKRIEAVRRIDPALRERVLGAGHRVRIVRRGLVQNRVDGDATALWVLSGRIRLSVFGDDGAETAVAVLESGECFGPIPRVDERVAASAEAIEDTELLVLDAASTVDPVVARFLEDAGIPSA